MHLLVSLKIFAACFVVVSSDSLNNQTQSTPKGPAATSELLINLDESLSRCGKYEIDIRELTLTEFQRHFQTGKLTSLELTKCYLNRIDKIDRYLKSVIEINREAIFLAKRADKERRGCSARSNLHGIPILIKDNIGTADSLQTTAGAKALENVKPKIDADVIQRLRQNGLIILGKTNPSEWAKDTNIPSGWSSRGGQTICAYSLDEDPSGSSTGSAVAVSANLAAIALGTETIGSIISPSSRNAVVGLKTTIGKIATKGLISLSFSNDVIGPIARTVSDAAGLMGIISDIDSKRCNGTCPEKVYKIGVPRDPFWNASDTYVADIAPALEACLKQLRRNNLIHVIDPIESIYPMPKINAEIETLIFAHEFKFSLNDYLKNNVLHLESRIGRKIFSLADVIKYNDLNPPSEGYDQKLLKMSEATDGLRNLTYLSARHENRRDSMNFIDSMFEKYGVDALLTPCDSNSGMNLFVHGAHGGYPSITVPIGVDDLGAPFGICLLGKYDSEAVLLKLGVFIEMARSTGRPTPRFKVEVLN